MKAYFPKSQASKSKKSCPRRNLKTVNSLGPHDALKHHFTSLKTDLILLQQRVLERNFHETNLSIHGNFL